MSEQKTDHQAPSADAISRGDLLKQGTKGAVVLAAGAATLTTGLGAAAAQDERARFHINGRAQASLTFGVWGAATDVKAIAPVIAKFSAKNPGINVKIQAIAAQGWAALFEVLLTRIASGTAPDVIRIAIEGIALLGSKNIALPMNDFMKKDAAYVEELRSDTLPVMWKALAYKGQQLGLPFSYNNMMVWYNTNLTSRPKLDWTADDFLAMCAKLKKQGKYGTNLWASGLFGLEAMSLAAGANLLSDDWTRSTATDPGNLVAWQFMYDLVHKYKYAPTPQANFPQTTFFESGRLGTFLAGRWPLQQLLLDKFPGGSMDVQFFPILGKGPRKVIFGIDGFPIIKSSKYPEAAWELAKYLSSKEAMTGWATQGTNIPCRKSLAYASWMKPPAHANDFYDSLVAGATAVTAPPQYNEVDTATTKWYTKMFAGQVSPKDALAGLDKDITAILKKPA